MNDAKNPFPAFVAALPPVLAGPDAVRPCNESEIARWEGLVPGELLQFWRAVGVGAFGEGVVHVCTPDALQEQLSVWLGPPSPTRVPFARSAFGVLFYWRDMREEAAERGMTGENPGELGDVSVVDVLQHSIEVLALDLEELFEYAFTDEGFIEQVLRRTLVRAAREIYGPLAPHEQLAFVPALALGGFEDIASVQKVNALVHQSILQQA